MTAFTTQTASSSIRAASAGVDIGSSARIVIPDARRFPATREDDVGVSEDGYHLREIYRVVVRKSVREGRDPPFIPERARG